MTLKSARRAALTAAVLAVATGIITAPGRVHGVGAVERGCAASSKAFIASIDTMKESRDTDRYPLSATQIAADVALSASLHTNYITVDVHWDYPQYMGAWITAVRRTGRHVWFRIQPNAWEGNNGVAATLTPSTYLTRENSFIVAHPTFFRSGDIVDMSPEPENAPYWIDTYGRGWTHNPVAVAAYNKFFVGVTDTASRALATVGVKGAITSIRSTNSWFAETPTALLPSTIEHMGRVTIDSYPDQYDTSSSDAVRDRLAELRKVESARPGVPIMIGEFGYSNKINVDDATQRAVVAAELDAIRPDRCIQGLNYWVGAGTQSSGGYTHLFAGSTGRWTPRPAAADLSSFFLRQRTR